MQGSKAYFATKDVLLVERKDEDVAKFHEKERIMCVRGGVSVGRGGGRVSSFYCRIGNIFILFCN